MTPSLYTTLSLVRPTSLALKAPSHPSLTSPDKFLLILQDLPNGTPSSQTAPNSPGKDCAPSLRHPQPLGHTLLQSILITAFMCPVPHVVKQNQVYIFYADLQVE